MNTEIPEINDNSRYSITQTMRMLGICYNTLKKKTLEGQIKLSYRKDGSKFYTGKSIKEFFFSKLE